MNNQIVASKNTGMIYQGFNAVATKDSLISFQDFATLVDDIISVIDEIDTMNPNNTYTIEHYFADILAVTADDPDYTFNYKVTFSVSNNIKTQFSFEDSETDIDNLENTIVSDIMDILGCNNAKDLPDILVTEFEIEITVEEATPDAGDGE